MGNGQKREELNMEIVGLVRDAKYSEVKDAVPPQFFTPYRQDDEVGSISFYVRTELPADQMLAAIPRVVAKLDSNLPVDEMKTMEMQIDENVFLDRLISTLSTAFAVLATVLAAVGLYGVLAYTIAQRTREFGLRMALGADGGRVRRMVLGQVARMALVGGVIGLLGAVAIGRLAGSLLYELESHDATVLVAAAAILGLVAFASGLVPAVRASRLDPMRALRYE